MLYSVFQTCTVFQGCQYTVNTNPDVNLTEVHVSPISAYITFGGHLALSATTLGFSNTGTVTWSVDGTNNGTITSDGFDAVYSAPIMPNPYGSVVNVRVTSDDDPSRFVECSVTLLPSFDAVFTANPRFVTTLTSSVQQLWVDTVSGAAVPAIRWVMESGPGIISKTGLYTPPAVIDSDGEQAVIRAISQTDSTIYSEATISLVKASDSELCYTRDIQPVLSASCGASGCHDADGHAGFSVLSYAGTVNDRNIIPGNARASRIFQNIIDFNANTRMPPPPQPALSQSSVLKIGQWINEGAKDCQ